MRFISEGVLGSWWSCGVGVYGGSSVASAVRVCWPSCGCWRRRRHLVHLAGDTPGWLDDVNDVTMTHTSTTTCIFHDLIIILLLLFYNYYRHYYYTCCCCHVCRCHRGCRCHRHSCETDPTTTSSFCLWVHFFRAIRHLCGARMSPEEKPLSVIGQKITDIEFTFHWPS